tara:strand:- start:5520 stop:6704 length:1185 start_codon:yes stop_codon:yes gene_type:complete
MPDPMTAIAGGGSILNARAASKGAATQAAAARDASAAEQRAIQQARRDNIKQTNLGVNELKSGRRNALNTLQTGYQRQQRSNTTGYNQGIESLRSGRDRSIRQINRGENRSINALQSGYEDTQNYYDPMLERGDRASEVYDYNLGIGDQPEGYGGYENSAYQNYIMDQSQSALEGSAAARGGLFSGATIKAATENAQGLSGQFYNNYLDRIGGVSDVGNAARAALAGYAESFSNNMAGTRTNAANNRAGIITNSANNISGARIDRGVSRGNIAANNASNRAGVYTGTSGAIANTRIGQGNALGGLSLAGGDAAATGIIGAANASAAGGVGAANAINSGIGNALGAYQYGQYADANFGAPLNAMQPRTYGTGGGYSQPSYNPQTFGSNAYSGWQP